MEVRGFTVGPVQENCYLLRRDASAASAVIVDPGDEPERLLEALSETGASLEAILVTHTHFDHVGAVAPLARATGAPVYCPELEVDVLANIMDHVRWAGVGPFESWDAEHTVAGGEHLQLAGFEIDVVFTPGHSAGHVTYAFRADEAHPGIPTVLAAGDVLFQGSVGRTDLPGGDHATLIDSIASLIERFDPETVILPGHMGTTTLGAEWASNPFLQELPASP
ncbi:unannotated protein [freshwater metagenome]|uniref:Unannotated protein n=1 Tax=freshwater metagenome TaxID=449393 RepID=A0A6J7D1E2_9ZZZZ|nr:MBL fold metallo-hydrolase [Actinomycetota bacterium]